MKRIRWAYSSRCLMVMLLVVLCMGARSQPAQPRQADVVYSQDVAPPPATSDWQRVDLPASSRQATAWYRVEFEAPRPLTDDAWGLYLPYLYGGGRLILNGVPLAHIREPGPDMIVRWERPHLVPISGAMLRAGTNQLLVRIAATPVSSGRMPLPEIGPYAQLLPDYERRLFWIRTMSQFTVISCLIVGAMALFIWLRRREESLYGLFGAASLLWGVRTLTLIIEEMPTTQWQAWRTIYHGATGGFVIVMLLFAMCLAGLHYPRLKWVLLGYWMLGPLGYLASNGNEMAIGRYWAGGLLPIGVGVLVISTVAAWRQRGPALIALSLALLLAVLAGVHDYLLASATPVIRALAPQAAAHRVFLLHYAADFLLVVMGGILSARLVGALQAVEQLNRTLEFRVAEREAALQDNYQRLRLLERQHAAGEERQQIMRDLHDGLGSQLFLTLSKAEIGRIDQGDMVQALRECIADMRLTLEAMSPESNDFLQAWGNFRFRWQQLLEAAGLSCSWETDAKDGFVELTPHVSIQLLRIVQEALTNVLKHAHAAKVAVRLRTDEHTIGIEVHDDGRGLGDSKATAGRGLANMRARALRVGAHLDISDLHPGVRVALDFRRGGAAAG
jgi:signal transduction histidine kinase